LQIATEPSIVAVSSESGFLHLIQTLFDSLGLPVRTTTDWHSAPSLVECLKPELVILDLVPGREESCWLALEAIKARRGTETVPVLICPVAGWLLAGHETRLAFHRVHVWPEGFALDDLLDTVQVALAASRTGHQSEHTAEAPSIT
jgi:DNA-binding NtrC family response regulator